MSKQQLLQHRKPNLLVDKVAKTVHKTKVWPGENLMTEGFMQMLAGDLAPTVLFVEPQEITMEWLDSYVTLASKKSVPDYLATWLLANSYRLCQRGVLQDDWHEGNIMIANGGLSQFHSRLPKFIDFGYVKDTRRLAKDKKLAVCQYQMHSVYRLISHKWQTKLADRVDELFSSRSYDQVLSLCLAKLYEL